MFALHWLRHGSGWLERPRQNLGIPCQQTAGCPTDHPNHAYWYKISSITIAAMLSGENTGPWSLTPASEEILTQNAVKHVHVHVREISRFGRE